MSKVKITFNRNFQKTYNEAVKESLMVSGMEYVAIAKQNISSVKHEVTFARALENHPIYNDEGVHTEGYHGGTKTGLVDSGDFIDSIDTSPKRGIFAFSSDGKSLFIGSNLEYARDLEEMYEEIEGKFGVLVGSLYEVSPLIRKNFISVFNRML